MMKALFRLTAWTLAIALVVLPVAAVLNGWIGGERWPMRHLRVSGEFNLVSDQQVRETVLPNVKKGYFAVDLEQVRRNISVLPWVKQVDVRKRWPDRLEVTVAEYKPLARWGENKLLAENGEIFAIPKNAKFKLPLFEAPDANTSDIMSFYSYAKPLFLTMGLQIQSIQMSARGSWSLTLSDGLEIEVGRGEPQQRLARFARLMPQIKNDALNRQLIRADLRYTNGFALSWKQAASKGEVENNLQQGNT
ncbi:MAG: cell division protein FtsQ/DivIB [Arenimonas sp.]